ncbi:MAG: NhaA family Na+:H+ antiporter, partial [Actinomycetes bacterium]
MASTPTPARTVPRAVLESLRNETIGGAILLVAAAVALIWANSPWSAEYFALADTKIGP